MNHVRLAVASAALLTLALATPALAADPGSRIGSPATRLPPAANSSQPIKAEIRPATSGANVSAARITPPQTSINAIKLKFEAFAASASGYEGMAKAVPGIVKQCAEKGYSAQDQKTAGCLPSDSVQQCSDKLVKYCIANFSNVTTTPNFFPTPRTPDLAGGTLPAGASKDSVTTGFTMQQFLQSGQMTAAEARALSQLLNLYAGQVEQAVKTAAP